MKLIRALVLAASLIGVIAIPDVSASSCCGGEKAGAQLLVFSLCYSILMPGAAITWSFRSTDEGFWREQWGVLKLCGAGAFKEPEPVPPKVEWECPAVENSNTAKASDTSGSEDVCAD